MTGSEQAVRAVGNTVFHEKGAGSGAYAALVVGPSLTSHWWLNILPLAQDAAIRYYITEDDLLCIEGRMHVVPEVLPAFLVFRSGYVVDWFPAPLPPRGDLVDPVSLINRVRERLRDYI
jgi:hypothetical protein